MYPGHRLMGCLGTLLSLTAARPALAEQVLWQIGTFDNSYAELGKTKDYRAYAKYYPKDAVFVIGKSDARTDWPFIHPGPRDQFAGRKPHAYVIKFQLDEIPTGRLTLRLDFVDVHHRYPPRLTIRVNQASTLFALRAGAGDVSLKDPSKGQEQVLNVGLDASLLSKGVNRITILNDFGSHVQYDALALLKQPDGVPGASRVVASATNLFINTDRGLGRVANVRIEGPAAHAGGRVRITVGSRTVEHKVAGVPLGDHALEVTFPSVEKVGSATVAFVHGTGTLTTTMAVPPTKKWKIYVAPTVHTDIGYTHHQSKIPAIHNANTDKAIELCGTYPDYKFRLECSWAAQMYERHRSAAEMTKLIELVRRRRIGIEANYVNMLTGLCSAEELTRLLYPSADLVRRYGIPFETATQNDVPSFVWSLPTILRRAGIRYLTVGVNNNGTRAPILRGGLDKRSPFRWAGPDGSKVLTWYAPGYVEIGKLGLTENVAAVQKKMTDWIARWDRRDDYPYDAILVHGAYGDNRSIGESLAKTVTEWNARYAYPKIIMSGFGEFFDYIETHFADRIPTVRGCGGCYWEDGAASSARETAINRNNHERIVAAEAVWAALTQLGPERTHPHDKINKTWENILLYDEHTWGARRWGLDPKHRSVVEQWATKSAFATDAERDSKALLSRGLARLGTKVTGRGKGVLVYNASSWDRSDLVRVTLPRGAVLVDPQGRKTPMQVLSVNDQTHDVCFLAQDVPGVGYRRYDVVEGRAERPTTTTPRRNGPRHLENRFYRVTLDDRSGGIASIVDKQTGVELVDATSPHKLGEVIYASGGAGTEAIAWRKNLPPAKFEFSRPNGATWQMTNQGKLLTSVRSSTRTKMFPKVGLEVTLYEHTKRLDLTVHLDKTLTYEMEGMYVAFPFAAERPRFRLEIGGGWVRPDRDMLPGACLDWFSVQHSVTLETGRAAVNLSPIDTPLMSLCQINTGKWLQKLDVTNGTVFAYVMNNYWLTNYLPGQGGEFTFRYSITSGKTMPATAATRHGWGVSQPLIATSVEAPAETAALPATGSFCRIGPPNVVLTAFKRAEDGDGVVLRFMEVGGKATRFDVGSGLLPPPKAVWRCDSVERKRAPVMLVRDGKVPVAIDAFGIETVCLQP